MPHHNILYCTLCCQIRVGHLLFLRCVSKYKTRQLPHHLGTKEESDYDRNYFLFFQTLTGAEALAALNNFLESGSPRRDEDQEEFEDEDEEEDEGIASNSLQQLRHLRNRICKG
jgi:hypothetical protein